MKRIVSPSLCLIVALCTYLLVGSGASAQSTSEQVYTIAQRQPEYPGGSAALSHYLAETIRIPGVLIRKNYNTGPISAKFIVDRFGYIHDVRLVTRPLDKKTLKEMQRYMASIVTAVEKMPRWQPGEVEGKPVAVFYTLPIEVTMR